MHLPFWPPSPVYCGGGWFLWPFLCFLIGYAADIGHLSGDSLTKTAKPRAIAVFVVGFWILDVANNMLQGPCRAFLADLSGKDHKKTRTANAFYSFFMAVGNVLGFASGSYTHLYRIFPFSRTKACDVYCANLKSCFFISIALLLTLTILALSYVREKPWSPEGSSGDGGNEEEGGGAKESTPAPFFGEIVAALKSLQRPMRILLLVTCLNWVAWFPFLLFDTDWMGREVYGGDSSRNADQLKMYDRGVRAGALGLLLNSVVLGFTSLGVEVLARGVGGVKRLWGIVNFILAICLAMTILITKVAQSNRRYTTVNGGTHLLPPPITYSIPFALASIFSNTSGAGQGLSLGVLNLSIVIPQMVVSVAAGPWDALFGGGNLPAFVVGAVAAAASGILAFTMLPSPPPDIPSNKRAATSTLAFI
ncbi:hypothetical protein NC653_031463 [Populus alba x Populus x berolinensis]|uniref:Sucrose transporter 1 n=1 Tax=Populus alba x Populus x berolinensis TaxID=444605 RepID=A0AAD6Q2R6_9ROSI|nr:hypothetical protein NC653_031463 [Populus alba x Populus x berolinensis]